MPHTPKDLDLDGLIGFVVPLPTFLVVASPRSSYIHKAHPDELVLRRPKAARVLAMMVGLWLSVGGAIFWYNLSADGVPNDRALGVAEEAVIGSLCAAVGLMLVYFSGLEDLHLGRRTYRRVSGWPLFPAAWSGGWGDMAGIYVISYVISLGTRGAIVGILWRHGRHRRKRIIGLAVADTTQLGRFESKRAADEFAEGVCSKLGLPRVELPEIL